MQLKKAVHSMGFKGPVRVIRHEQSRIRFSQSQGNKYIEDTRRVRHHLFDISSRITHLIEELGVYSFYSYRDDGKRLHTIEYSIDGQRVQTNYEYDIKGRLIGTKVIYPDGSIFSEVIINFEDDCHYTESHINYKGIILKKDFITQTVDGKCIQSVSWDSLGVDRHELRVCQYKENGVFRFSINSNDEIPKEKITYMIELRDTQGRISEQITYGHDGYIISRRYFIYNEYSDVMEIIEFQPQTTARFPSTIKFEYQYDRYGNWTEKKRFEQRQPEGKAWYFAPAYVERRELYYHFDNPDDLIQYTDCYQRCSNCQRLFHKYSGDTDVVCHECRYPNRVNA